MTSEPLNLTHVSTFLSVVEYGGFTRASHALHLSQSTVSQHVRALETRLGVALVNRAHLNRHGRLTLTADGVALLEEAGPLLNAHDRLLSRFVAPTQRSIAIGSTEHAADRVLPLLVDVLQRTYPRHQITFTIDRSLGLTAAVEQGRLDLALTLGTSASAPGIHLADLGLRWLSGIGVDVATDRRTLLPLVAFDNPCGIRDRALSLLREANIESRVTAQASTLDGVLSLARSGLGVALLPIAAGVPDGLHLEDGLPDAGAVSVNLVVRDGFDESTVHAAHTAIADLLRGITRNHNNIDAQ